MKVGILTVNGFNCGSFLQAFALKKFVEELGHKSYILNTLELRLIYSVLSPFGLKKALNFLSAWKKVGMHSCLRHYDVVVVGSDIVWAKHKSDIFFGHKIKTDKMIAYAPCCAETTYDELSNIRVEGIKSMYALSARDENTAKMVQDIIGEKPVIVLDPTFLIDWSEYEIPTGLDNYILVYSYNGKIRKMIIKAKQLSKETGMKIISVPNYIYWCGMCIPVLPFEFLGLIRQANYVVTDTFHGTAFSLIYKKPFISFPHSHKVEFLLDSFRIKHNELFDDYAKIADVMRKNRRMSKRYLKNAIL